MKNIKIIIYLFVQPIFLTHISSQTTVNGSRAMNNDTIHVLTSHANYLYAGIDNYIEINRKILPYKNMLIEVAKGMAIEDNGNYMILVGRPGTTTLSIYQYDFGDTILVFQKVMIIKAVPAPYITFNGKKLDDMEYIEKSQLRSIKKFEVKLSDDLVDDDEWFTIKSITIGYPYGQQYITKTCEGPLLSNDVLKDIANLSAGKEIAFAFTLIASGDVYKRIAPIRLKLY